MHVVLHTPPPLLAGIAAHFPTTTHACARRRRRRRRRCGDDGVTQVSEDDVGLGMDTRSGLTEPVLRVMRPVDPGWSVATAAREVAGPRLLRQLTDKELEGTHQWKARPTTDQEKIQVRRAGVCVCAPGRAEGGKGRGVCLRRLGGGSSRNLPHQHACTHARRHARTHCRHYLPLFVLPSAFLAACLPAVLPRAEQGRADAPRGRAAHRGLWKGAAGRALWRGWRGWLCAAGRKRLCLSVWGGGEVQLGVCMVQSAIILLGVGAGRWACEWRSVVQVRGRGGLCVLDARSAARALPGQAHTHPPSIRTSTQPAHKTLSSHCFALSHGAMMTTRCRPHVHMATPPPPSHTSWSPHPTPRPAPPGRCPWAPPTRGTWWCTTRWTAPSTWCWTSRGWRCCGTAPPPARSYRQARAQTSRWSYRQAGWGEEEEGKVGRPGGGTGGTGEAVPAWSARAATRPLPITL